jgi:hypothetical protein
LFSSGNLFPSIIPTRYISIAEGSSSVHDLTFRAQKVKYVLLSYILLLEYNGHVHLEYNGHVHLEYNGHVHLMGIGALTENNTYYLNA